jgi:HAD superfamily hydrolase (TIGR01549 family)
MQPMIEAILFDMGGTLRSSRKVDPRRNGAVIREIIDLIGAKNSVDELTQLLVERSEAYSQWARQTLVELNEVDLWTKWLLPDWPADQIAPIAIDLNQLWRKATGERIIFPETRDVVLELFRRGYRLGLVSNTVSSVEVPRALEEMQLTGCFETVILSCVVGKRKPGADILLEATNRMGIAPDRCAYIGDRIHRDVLASREAGMPKVILLRSADSEWDQFSEDPAKQPDQYIENLTELLKIFPPVNQLDQNEPGYQVSLSTMWAIGNFPSLADFFETARRMGFAKVELNHQVDSSMLKGVEPPVDFFSSVHEPCPSDVTTSELRNRDWLISSPDEDNRRRGVEAIKPSIDLAAKVGGKVVVVHCGTLPGLVDAEQRMRMMIERDEIEPSEFISIKQSMVETRARQIGPYFESVKRSLRELIEYARGLGVCLGLENRYHYYDIPTPEEMDELLSLGNPEQVGFIYDVGHAQTLDRLGFYPHEEWLRKFSSRMVGVHLHDVVGVTDHLAPGLGEVDFEMVARYIPDTAYRAFEVRKGNSMEEVKAALAFLAKYGIVQ